MKKIFMLLLTASCLTSGHFASAKAACGASSPTAMNEQKYDVAYLTADKKKKPSKVKWIRSISKETK